MYSGLADEDIQPVGRLRAAVEGRVDLAENAPADEDALIRALSGADVVFCTSRLPVTRRVLSESELRVVAKIGTGLDSVDLDAARELGVAVTHTPGVNAMAVAEHALGLLLATMHRSVVGRDALREGQWRDELELGNQLYGKTVGIVGYGNVGSRLAGLLSPFRADLLVHDPYVAGIDTEYAGAELASLERLLAESDAVVVCAELTDETRGMIGADEFDRTREGAVLVNTARGPIVRTDALVDAVESGGLAGAGLDVFEEEPLPPESPLHDLENVVTTPHIAGVKAEPRARAMELLAEHAIALLDGEPVPERYLAVPP